MIKEISYEVKNYMYTATLETGVIITAYEDGSAIGSDGNRYRLVSQLDENEEVCDTGWVIVK